MALLRWPIQFIIICLFSLVQAYTVFETHCSAPVTSSNYVSSPNTRGTLDILWSSLFTIFACTWSVQHPNLPEQLEAEDHDSPLKGWRAWTCPAWRSAKWSLKAFYRSTLRMLWTGIAPELIVVAACNELMGALSLRHKMKKLDLGKGETWSLSHSYYANMGGFVVRNSSANKTIFHEPYHLTGEELFKLRKEKHISRLPDISEAEIKDKSKGDMLGKSIATGQITWSTIQIIARVVRKLPVSPLEVAVVAFAVCAVIIYALYWVKPQRVVATHAIPLNHNNQLYNRPVLEKSPRFLKGTFHTVLEFVGISSKKPLLRGAPISVDSRLTNKSAKRRKTIIPLIAISVSATLFGGVHAVAWNFSFPTKIELLLWRYATICTVTAPIGVIVPIILSDVLPVSDRLHRHLKPFFILVGILLTALYSIARLFILVEMFRTLYFLPPGSFISTWATSVPHVA